MVGPVEGESVPANLYPMFFELNMEAQYQDSPGRWVHKSSDTPEKQALLAARCLLGSLGYSREVIATERHVRHDIAELHHELARVSTAEDLLLELLKKD